MPRYKVKSPGFDGKMYSPNGKRNVLHRDEPFPKGKDGKEKVPSWLEAMQDETPEQKKKRIAAEKKAAKAAQKKAADDKTDIENASLETSFLDKSSSKKVETL